MAEDLNALMLCVIRRGVKGLTPSIEGSRKDSELMSSSLAQKRDASVLGNNEGNSSNQHR